MTARESEDFEERQHDSDGWVPFLLGTTNRSLPPFSERAAELGIDDWAASLPPASDVVIHAMNLLLTSALTDA
jgi:hypothetical protein